MPKQSRKRCERPRRSWPRSINVSTPSRGFRRWLRLPRSHTQVARDVDDEIAFHLAMREEKLRTAGLSSEEAAHRARERFGDTRTVASECVEIDIETIRAERREDFVGSLIQ